MLMLNGTHTTAQPPASVSVALRPAEKFPLGSKDGSGGVLAAAVIAVVPRGEAFSVLQLTLPFELFLFLSRSHPLSLLPTYAHIHPLHSFRLNSSCMMRSILHCQSVNPYHLYSSTLIEQTSAHSVYCE